jgi:hypothetical protein
MIFDPKNPNGRFWSEQTWTAKDGSHLAKGIEYRVELKNNTDKTIEKVILTNEILTSGKIEPGNCVFVRNKSETIEIHPKSSEPAIVCLLQPGIPVEETEIVMRARAKDTPEASLRFAVTPDGALVPSES